MNLKRFKNTALEYRVLFQLPQTSITIYEIEFRSSISLI